MQLIYRQLPATDYRANESTFGTIGVLALSGPVWLAVPAQVDRPKQVVNMGI